jgi:hypothetical protein
MAGACRSAPTWVATPTLQAADEAVLSRDVDGRDTIGDRELRENILDVDLRRLLADAERGRDFLVRIA